MSSELGNIIFGKPIFEIWNILHGWLYIVPKFVNGVAPPLIPEGINGLVRSAVFM